MSCVLNWPKIGRRPSFALELAQGWPTSQRKPGGRRYPAAAYLKLQGRAGEESLLRHSTNGILHAAVFSSDSSFATTCLRLGRFRIHIQRGLFGECLHAEKGKIGKDLEAGEV